MDTTWGRVPGGAEIGVMTDDVIAHFDPAHPEASVPTLIKIHHLLAGLPADLVLDEKRRQLDHILQECLGLEVETTIPQAEVVPGETLRLHHTATLRSDVPVRWLGVRYPGANHRVNRDVEAIDAESDCQQTASRDNTTLLPADHADNPALLVARRGQRPGFSGVDDASLIGRPENPPVFPMEQVFEVSGEKFVVPDEPVQVIAIR